MSSSGSLAEQKPGQWLQTLQFHSIQDCGREYFRISEVVSINWGKPEQAPYYCKIRVLLAAIYSKFYILQLKGTSVFSM